MEPATSVALRRLRCVAFQRFLWWQFTRQLRWPSQSGNPAHPSRRSARLKARYRYFGHDNGLHAALRQDAPPSLPSKIACATPKPG